LPEDEEKAKRRKQWAMKGKRKEGAQENKMWKSVVFQGWAKRTALSPGFGSAQDLRGELSSRRCMIV
jgi:hypothetical protein